MSKLFEIHAFDFLLVFPYFYLHTSIIYVSAFSTLGPQIPSQKEELEKASKMENMALSKALGEVLAACSLLSFLVVYQNITVHVTVHLPYDS